MVNTVWVNTDHGRDIHLHADHMTRLRNFTKEENRDISAFRFSVHLVLEQALSNLIVCLMISPKNTHKSCTHELACLTRFNKICHSSQRPRWQVDKERKPLAYRESNTTFNLCVTRHPEICVNLVFKHIHAASSYTIHR